jgi:hypothetical protein
MTIETTAWLVVSVAGIASGVIAGLQPRVTAGAIIAISTVVAVAAGIVTWLLPRQPDHAP